LERRKVEESGSSPHRKVLVVRWRLTEGESHFPDIDRRKIQLEDIPSFSH
jgi:hypothetical protein